jgi:hypothetical protein
MKYLLLFWISINVSVAYKICIAGATSGLGKELLYQSIGNKNVELFALSSSLKELTVPCRTNSFQEIKTKETFDDPSIIKGNYWEDITKYDYDHLVLTTGAKPFENDYSDELTHKFIEHLSTRCKSISLVSAYGVGDSLNLYEPGISIMNIWYLKDVYRAKYEQERMLNSLDNVLVKIYRPKALSYGDTALNSISRKDLAEQILSEIDLSENNMTTGRCVL